MATPILTRRRLLLSIAAGLCGSAAIGGWLLYRGARSARLRAIDVAATPLDAALWLADAHPEYFLVEGDEVRAWSQSLPHAARDQAVSVASWLLLRWASRQAELLPPSQSGRASALAAIRLVRNATVNQLEMSFDRKYCPEAEHPDFALVAWGRLVRGFTNCDGQNHLLALLLSARHAIDATGYDVKLVRPRGGGHLLVELLPPGGAPSVFVDAWSNVVPFAAPGSPPIPDVIAFEELDSPEATALPKRIVRRDEVKLLKNGVSAWDLPGIGAPALEPWPPDLDQAPIRPPDAPGRDLLRQYLAARSHEVSGEAVEAFAAYRTLERGACSDPANAQQVACAATRAMLDRLWTPVASPP